MDREEGQSTEDEFDSNDSEDDTMKETRYQARDGDFVLDPTTLQAHYRHTLIPHLFEKTGGIADTQGQVIPTWAHGNPARDIVRHLDATELPSMQRRWNRLDQLSVQTWNPFAHPGSAAARNPKMRRVQTKRS